MKILRLAGFFGLASPLLGFAMVLLAINASPWFSWTDNALSDLGVSGFGSVLFNSGLAMTGALMLMFFLGPHELTKGSKLGRLGSYLFLASALFLVGVGVFNETFGSIHLYVSVGFFVSLILSLLVLGIHFAFKKRNGFALLALTAGAVGVIFWLMPWDGVAIPEAVSALAASFFTSITGIWMLRVNEGS